MQRDLLLTLALVAKTVATSMRKMARQVLNCILGFGELRRQEKFERSLRKDLLWWYLKPKLTNLYPFLKFYLFSVHLFKYNKCIDKSVASLFKPLQIPFPLYVTSKLFFFAWEFDQVHGNKLWSFECHYLTKCYSSIVFFSTLDRPWPWIFRFNAFIFYVKFVQHKRTKACVVVKN